MNGGKRWLSFAVELALWAAFAVFALVSVSCFDTVPQAPELWDYLAPDRLEERQLKWLLAGLLYAVPVLGALAGAIGMEVHRRRKKGGRE